MLAPLIVLLAIGGELRGSILNNRWRRSRLRLVLFPLDWDMARGGRLERETPGLCGIVTVKAQVVNLGAGLTGRKPEVQGGNYQ